MKTPIWIHFIIKRYPNVLTIVNPLKEHPRVTLILGGVANMLVLCLILVQNLTVNDSKLLNFHQTDPHTSLIIPSTHVLLGSYVKLQPKSLLSIIRPK